MFGPPLSDSKPRERGVTSDSVSAVSEANRARADSVPGSSSVLAVWRAAHHAAVQAQCPDPRSLVRSLQESDISRPAILRHRGAVSDSC